MRRVKTVAIWLPILECGPDEFLERFYDLTIGDLTVYTAETSPVPPTTDDANEEENSTLILEENEGYLKSLDPAEWKDHDHYHVLGLQSKRINATAADIKNAYRQLCLKHHPDKRKVCHLEEVCKSGCLRCKILKSLENEDCDILALRRCSNLQIFVFPHSW